MATTALPDNEKRLRLTGHLAICLGRSVDHILSRSVPLGEKLTDSYEYHAYPVTRAVNASLGFS